MLFGPPSEFRKPATDHTSALARWGGRRAVPVTCANHTPLCGVAAEKLQDSKDGILNLAGSSKPALGQEQAFIQPCVSFAAGYELGHHPHVLV